MADQPVVARSPIVPAPPEVVVGGWVVSGRRSTAELTLTDLSPLAKVAVRADPLGPAAEALVSQDDGTRLVTTAVPGEWLVLGAPGEQAAIVRSLAPLTSREQLVSVVDLTHGRALLRLTGRRAGAVLARECAVDLSDRGCPDGTALRTAVAGLAVEVVRDDRAAVPSYLLHCERSSGQYFHDALLDAGAAFGIDVDGFTTPGISPGRRRP